MKRLVWCWWVLVAAVTNQQDADAAADVRTQERHRSLKKKRIHGDYYFGNQPDPIILGVDDGPGTVASDDSSKEERRPPDQTSDGGSSHRQHAYDDTNSTMVMSKLKGGTPSDGYNAEKRGEKEHDDDSNTKPDKVGRSPSKSPTVQSKGSTTTTGSTKQRKKKNENHDTSKESGSSSKKKSKLTEGKSSRSESRSSKSEGEKGQKKNAKKDDSDTGGSGPSGKCISSAASAILDALPQVTALNPESCCEQTEGIAAYLTHATIESNTESGLSRFWQEAYDSIAKASAIHGVCFVFVAASTTDDTELEQTMHDMIITVSTMPDVVAMMVTDPTSTGSLMELVRSISDDATLPAIAVFNAGYSNIIVDSIVTGQRRLPYIGSIDEADYGKSAATMTQELLNGATPVPMCFQAGEDPQRCYAYYVDLAVPDSPPFPCNATTNSIIYDIPSSVNAIFAPAGCCAAIIAAARDDVVIGCQDHDVVEGLDFVTQQPVALQAATAATWSNFVVQFGMAGAQSFPGLQTLVATDVYSILAS